MIEAVTIPILMKAVDFLFNEEGSKILQERRERRKAELEAQKSDKVGAESSSEKAAGTATRANVIHIERCDLERANRSGCLEKLGSRSKAFIVVAGSLYQELLSCQRTVRQVW